MQLLMESTHVVQPLLTLDVMAGPLQIGMQLERDTGVQYIYGQYIWVLEWNYD